jgi:sugar (pentulose or hexulose) kinase
LFVAPGNMPERIREFCRKTEQAIPQEKGQVVRCIAESLAMKYRQTVESLEEILDKKLNTIHMVGGGIKDRLLCQFTANATARNVIAGPIEATAAGNLLIQAIALGKVADIKEARQIVKKSFPTQEYKAQSTVEWNTAYERFVAL